MKAKWIIAALQVLALSVGASTASADAAGGRSREVTRAEVIADLELWQRSGLVNLRGQKEVDGPAQSDQVRRAKQRYAAQRAALGLSDQAAGSVQPPREIAQVSSAQD